jgi:hypothetical protein
MSGHEALCVHALACLSQTIVGIIAMRALKRMRVKRTNVAFVPTDRAIVSL